MYITVILFFLGIEYPPDYGVKNLLSGVNIRFLERGTRRPRCRQHKIVNYKALAKHSYTHALWAINRHAP